MADSPWPERSAPYEDHKSLRVDNSRLREERTTLRMVIKRYRLERVVRERRFREFEASTQLVVRGAVTTFRGYSEAL